MSICFLKFSIKFLSENGARVIATDIKTRDQLAPSLEKIKGLKTQNLSPLRPHELTDKHIWDFRLYLSRKKDYKGNYLKKTSQSYYLRYGLSAAGAEWLAREFEL